MHPKVSGLATWSENCKSYGSLPLGAVVSLFCKSSEFCHYNPLCYFSTRVYYCWCVSLSPSPETFGYTLVHAMCYVYTHMITFYWTTMNSALSRGEPTMVMQDMKSVWTFNSTQLQLKPRQDFTFSWFLQLWTSFSCHKGMHTLVAGTVWWKPKPVNVNQGDSEGQEWNLNEEI